MADERKKKDGRDVGKKRKRMREEVARRQADAGASSRSQRDEVDKLKYKRGSAGDRTRVGAP